MNVLKSFLKEIQRVRIARIDGTLLGIATFETLNQRVAGSNPARLTSNIKGLRGFRTPFFYAFGVYAMLG